MYPYVVIPFFCNSPCSYSSRHLSLHLLERSSKQSSEFYNSNSSQTPMTLVKMVVEAPSPTTSESCLPEDITPTSSPRPDIITKFTNCHLLRSTSNPSSQCAVTYKLVSEDLFTSSLTGTILDGQEVFYAQQRKPDVVIDCGGKIISPGFIDMQLNGGFGVNFSDVPEMDDGGEWDDVRGGDKFKQGLEMVNRALIPTGVTSYLPTLTSQRSEVYYKVCRSLSRSFQISY